MTEILIIDDDKNLMELLVSFFNNNGYQAQTAYNGREGLQKIYHKKPDIIVLDVTMPVKNGWETLKDIREIADIPVIMLTARSDELDVLRGFSQGADDYVTKPFSFAQLEARVRAVLARTNQSGEGKQEMLESGDLSVDLNTNQVFRAGKIIRLSPTEFKLLIALMQQSGKVISAADLVKEVWGPQYAGETGHVRRYIWHLRKKLESDLDAPQYIHNERGFGYRFGE